MIKILTGAPGSGKSYYIVKYIKDQYFEKIDDDYYKVKEGFTLISNLEGLKLEHLDLDSVIKASGIEYTEFFTVPYQEKIIQKYKNLIYVIDEAQRYFDERIDKKYDVVYFFEYHRHLGIDFFLLTQTYDRLSRKIRGLEEHQIHAQNRISSLTGELNYQIRCGNEIIDKKVLIKSDDIFRLYKSRSKEENEKVKNPLIKYLVMMIVLIIAGFFLFHHTFMSGSLADTKIKTKKNNKDKIEMKNDDKSEIKIKELKDYKIPIEIGYIKIGNEIYVYENEINRFIPIELIKKDLIIIQDKNNIIKLKEYKSYNEIKDIELVKAREAGRMESQRERAPVFETKNKEKIGPQKIGMQ